MTDRQTDRQNYNPQDHASIAGSRGKKHTQHSRNITTETNERTEKLSSYWNETSAVEDHTYIFQRFANVYVIDLYYNI